MNRNLKKSITDLGTISNTISLTLKTIISRDAHSNLKKFFKTSDGSQVEKNIADLLKRKACNVTATELEFRPGVKASADKLEFFIDIISTRRINEILKNKQDLDSFLRSHIGICLEKFEKTKQGESGILVTLKVL